MDRNVNDYTFMKLSGKILWLIQLVKNFRDKRLARLHGILPFLGFCFGNAGSWRTLSNSPEKQDLSARCSFLDLTPGHLGRLSEQVPDRNQPAVIAYIFRHFLELFLANKHGVLLRISPLPTLRVKLRIASPVSSMLASPAIMAPVSMSMMSGMRLANAEFEDILITGAIGLPVGVPNPVVNRTTFAPAATWAVTHSTSFPGVHKRFNPGSVAYSG